MCDERENDKVAANKLQPNLVVLCQSNGHIFDVSSNFLCLLAYVVVISIYWASDVLDLTSS